MKILDQFDEEIDVSNGYSKNNEYIPAWIFKLAEASIIAESIKYGYIDRDDFIKKKDGYFECKLCKGNSFVVNTIGYDAIIICPICGYKIILLSA